MDCEGISFILISSGTFELVVHFDIISFLNNVLLKTKRQMKNQRTQSIKYGLVQKIDYNFIIIIMQL